MILCWYFSPKQLGAKRTENEILTKIRNGDILLDSVDQIWYFPKPIILDTKLKNILCWP